MKSKIIVGTSLVLGSNSSFGSKSIAVKDLTTTGINQKIILKKFLAQGIHLNPDELLEVSEDHEGKHIKFETMDHISVLVSIGNARGVGNKDRTGQ